MDRFYIPLTINICDIELIFIIIGFLQDNVSATSSINIADKIDLLTSTDTSFAQSIYMESTCQIINLSLLLPAR